MIYSGPVKVDGGGYYRLENQSDKPIPAGAVIYAQRCEVPVLALPRFQPGRRIGLSGGALLLFLVRRRLMEGVMGVLFGWVGPLCYIGFFTLLGAAAFSNLFDDVLGA